MPSDTAGLVRYFDDYKETYQIKPEYVFMIITAVIIIEITLKYMA